MSLLSSTFSELDTSSNNKMPYNTGTLFDLATGAFDQGVDGEMYLTGGLGCQFNSFVGQNGHFKSTFAGGLITRAAALYNDGGLVIRDTEDSISRDRDRILRMPGEYKDRLDPESVHWVDIKYDLEAFDEWLLQHCAEKDKQKNDLMIETPLLDPKTMKPFRQIVPTFILEDSFTEEYSERENDMLNDTSSGKSGMGDTASNTVFLKDGNRKTMWTRTMRRRCQEFGLVLVLTGHYDQKYALDSFHPNVKETTFGKQDWVVKGVGSKFKFLSSIYARTQAILLQDSNKEALYNNGFTPARDIFEVDVMIDRCKATIAGTMTPFVCSQTDGLLNAVTNYHYIKLDDFWGCDGSKQKQQLKMLPNITISRNTIRQISEGDYMVRRALEITAQLCYIKNNWNPAIVRYDLKKDSAKIFEWLSSDTNKTLKEDILNSRGWWSPKKEDRPYMSIFSILDKLK